MIGIRKFEEFLEDGAIKIQQPDKSRSIFLTKEADEAYDYLPEMIKRLGVIDKSVNDIVKKCYDILMGIVRAEMLMHGYNASGKGAHEAEIAYLRVFGLKEADVQFADQMRYFRNGMLYYGTRVDTAYTLKVIEFTKKIYPILRKKVKV